MNPALPHRFRPQPKVAVAAHPKQRASLRLIGERN
jgi:hypothetical protein